MPLAGGQTNVLFLYYLWGSSRHPKDSCGHETADKDTKQAKLFHQRQTLITDDAGRGP